MKVNDPYFVLEKTEKYLKEDIYPSRIIEKQRLNHWQYYETQFDEKMDDLHINTYENIDWKEYQLGQPWGGYDQVAWFKREVTIPKEWSKGKVAFRLLLGPRDGGGSTAEGLIYIDGKPIQGVDIWHDEVILPKEIYTQKSSVSVAIKVWSGVLDTPMYRRFTEADIQLIDDKVEQFYYVLETLVRSIKLLDEKDLKRIQLTQDVNDTINHVNFLNIGDDAYYASIDKASEYINVKLQSYRMIEEIKPKVQGIGHSHIDMAWLWRLGATREKASRTFSTVLNLMKHYPEYRFFHSSPQLYKYIKSDYPEIYKEIQEKVKEGVWEIDGGMWVESDTNIPSGESLVRQFLYGKQFIKEEFGQNSEILWLPDVFGYSAALPQIMKKSGIKYFMTTKISWNQYNHFPYDTFWWSGLDRSEVFTHFITTPEDESWFYTYNGQMNPKEVVGVWDNYKDKDKNDELLIAFGWGDGGGGPTKEMLEQSRVMKNIPGIPYVKIDSAKSYFDNIYNHIDHTMLNRWQGELYFEYHRGTYTTQGKSKWFNRKIENNLHDLEFLLSYIKTNDKDFSFDKSVLDSIWEKVLLLQFHDVLPGTSIRAVYEESEVEYNKIMKQLQEYIRHSLHTIQKNIKVETPTVLIINTLGFLRDDYVIIPYSEEINKDTLLFDQEEPLETHPTSAGLLCYVNNLPGYGMKGIEYSNKNISGKNTKIQKIEDQRFENDFFILELNDNGEIKYLFDKKNQRRISIDEPINQFVAYEDKPQRFDAWDIDIYYKQKPYSSFKRIQSEVIEHSPLRTVIRQEWTFNQSSISQDMILYHQVGRIDFQTTANWNEKQVLLKVYFPFDVHSDEATYEIQYGNIKRPTHTNTEQDFAKFEVCGHRYADLSEQDYGVAVMNDCKYGYDSKSNRIGLTLIKSPIKPDADADKTIHHFTYSLFPHKGDLFSSDVQQEAMKLNYPLYTQEVSLKPQGRRISKKGLVECEIDHIIIDTVKIAESEDAIIVRLFEFKNRHTFDGKIKIHDKHVSKVIETNLIEEEEQNIDVVDNEFSFSLTPYEIKTFKIIMD